MKLDLQSFSMKEEYLFVLGKDINLSVAELKGRVDITEVDETLGIALGENIKLSNPRDIPKNEYQVFLDQLGGTIRYGKVVGRYDDWDDFKDAFLSLIPAERKTPKFRVGVSVFGASSKSMREELFDVIKGHTDEVRIANPPRENMTSARIFDERVIQKGVDILVWFKGDHYVLAKTVASQNIRNYTVRDRKKNFRDSHMGMMPPKLAQIMINLATSGQEAGFQLWDPFCGSGTTNIEATLLGYKTIGSDLEKDRVDKSKENYEQMAEHFKFEPTDGSFFVGNATKFPPKGVFEKSSPLAPLPEGGTALVVATEGYLGHNFRGKPTPGDVQRNQRLILDLWQNILGIWKQSGVGRACFCLPCWRIDGKFVSISAKILALAENHGFKIENVVEESKTYTYARPDAIVGREICMISRSTS